MSKTAQEIRDEFNAGFEEPAKVSDDHIIESLHSKLDDYRAAHVALLVKVDQVAKLLGVEPQGIAGDGPATIERIIGKLSS